MARKSFALIAALLATGASAQFLVEDLADRGHPGASWPSWIASAGSYAVFSTYTNDFGSEPFVTDGTAAGTIMLRDIHSGPAYWARSSGSPTGRLPRARRSG